MKIVWMCVCVGFVMCVPIGNMCTCIYMYFVLFVLCFLFCLVYVCFVTRFVCTE
jgi:hypothetical protein